MKKIKLLLTAVMLFASTSCNNETTNDDTLSPSPSEQEPLSSESLESPSIDEESSLDETFDTSKYQESKFLNVEEIYLLPEETYELSKMKLDGTNLASLNYLSSIPSNVSVEEDGTLIGITNENEEIISGSIYVYTDTHLQEITVHIVDYYTYGSYFTSVDLGRLYNKNVMFFGDSITHNWAKYPWGRRPENEEEQSQADSVNSLGYPDHYIPLLNQKCNFKSIINTAWSGGTMAYRPAGRPIDKSFPYCVDEQFENIKNMDYIFVLYGTNDADDQVPIGTIRDTLVTDGKTNGTFMGSMKYGIETIREANPDAIIIFMNVIYRTRAIVGNIQLNDYNEAIDTLCKSYACRLLDTYSMFDPQTASQYLNEDGLHLNSLGYSTLVDYILNNGKKDA